MFHSARTLLLFWKPEFSATHQGHFGEKSFETESESELKVHNV